MLSEGLAPPRLLYFAPRACSRRRCAAVPRAREAAGVPAKLAHRARDTVVLLEFLKFMNDVLEREVIKAGF